MTSTPDPRTERAHTDGILKIGTRGSQLATTQAGHVQQGVIDAGYPAELHIVHTPGDASQAAQTPVAQIGIGVFTETLRTALAAGECDIAVHSYKDLPTAPDPRFRVIVPPRVDPREVLISVDNTPLLDLPQGAKVGTGAPRRISQVLRARPDLQLQPLRGNIGTRMNRVGTDLDAVILARAGLERIGELDRAAESIDPRVIMPAPAQGALAVEVRADDERAWAAVRDLDCRRSHACVIAERAMLATLEAGCTAPVAAYTTCSDGPLSALELTLHGGVFALDGTAALTDSATITLNLEGDRAADSADDLTDAGSAPAAYSQAADLGRRIGEQLLAAGARDFFAPSTDLA